MMHLRADPACSSWRYRGFKDAREKSTPASMVDPAGRATGIILQFFLHPYRCEVDPEHGTAGDVCQDVTLPISTSAPIAGGATAGLTGLLFTSSLSNPWLVGVPVGMWAKASISPLSELAREAEEAQPVGDADRPHIHRPSW